jgi:hypothetical protein
MCYEYIGALKDVVLTVAAATGAIVAVKGLGTWRNQLYGQSEYELSRRILVSLFKYRDSVNALRHPVMWPNEMPYPPEEKAKIMNDHQIRYHGTSGAYQKRFSKVQEQRTALYTDLLEAEALWGASLKDIFKRLFNLEHELAISIHQYLTTINPDESPETRKQYAEIRGKNRDIMYDDLSDDGDDFRKELTSILSEIESYLKPKLTHTNT